MSCNGCTSCCVVPVLFNKHWSHKEMIKPHYRNTFKFWIPIKKREAKKRNPYLVKRIKLNKFKRVNYFKCKALGLNGCTRYDDRPPVCSGYPYYKDNLFQLKERYTTSATEYTEHCNLIQVTIIDNNEEYIDGRE